MTPTWLALARGPLFYLVMTILILGLARLVFLALWGMAQAIHRAGDRRIPYAQVLKETATWLVPLGHLHRTRPVYSYASFLLHVGLILGGLALQNHIDILYTNTGLAWPALPRLALDIVTVLAIIAGFYLLLHRLYRHSARALSRPMDYVLLLLILNLMVSGYVAGRPWNPIPYNSLMHFHTLNGLVLLGLIPFTKIAHCVLFPLVRLASEVAWHLAPQGGSDVVRTLYGPEGRKI
jgi:nitrate reductase gamma subunit